MPAQINNQSHSTIQSINQSIWFQFEYPYVRSFPLNESRTFRAILPSFFKYTMNRLFQISCTPPLIIFISPWLIFISIFLETVCASQLVTVQTLHCSDVVCSKTKFVNSCWLQIEVIDMYHKYSKKSTPRMPARGIELNMVSQKFAKFEDFHVLCVQLLYDIQY